MAYHIKALPPVFPNPDDIRPAGFKITPPIHANLRKRMAMQKTGSHRCP
jgi:hypothetical protein